MLGFILDSARNNMLVSGLWGLFLIHFHFPRVYKVRGNSKFLFFTDNRRQNMLAQISGLIFTKIPPFPPCLNVEHS